MKEYVGEILRVGLLDVSDTPIIYKECVNFA